MLIGNEGDEPWSWPVNTASVCVNLYSVPQVGAKYCDKRVCLSARSLISRKTHPNRSVEKVAFFQVFLFVIFYLCGRICTQ